MTLTVNRQIPKSQRRRNSLLNLLACGPPLCAGLLLLNLLSLCGGHHSDRAWGGRGGVWGGFRGIGGGEGGTYGGGGVCEGCMGGGESYEEV